MHNLIFIFYGFLAILAQLLIFRELSVLFYGSELFLGTFLSSWLFWTGFGSIFIGRLLKKERVLGEYFSYGFLVISVLFPSLILLIRASKSMFAFGEFIAPLLIILYTFSVMSILCFIIGGQFSLACGTAVGKIKSKAILAQVYLCEVFGGVVGGVVFTYMLIGIVPIFIISLFLSLGCILAALWLLNKNKSFKDLFLIAGALVMLLICFKAEPMVNRIEWKGYQFIKQKETRNATLTLVNMGSIKNVFVDGVIQASFPGAQSYEPVAHWPLLASASPERVLVIGDASLGVLKEVLKHKPQHLDYVVTDNSFIDFITPYLSLDDLRALNDPATRIYYVDPRIFVRENKNKYDVVIINIPEVSNLKANRFYTQEFFAQLKFILKPSGILGLNIASSENYLSSASRIFNASVYITLRPLFEIIEVIPGDNLIFFASLAKIDLQTETFLKRFSERGLLNNYVIPSYLEYKLQLSRRVELKKLLVDTPKVGINKDFSPTTHYYFTNFWLNKFALPSGILWVIFLISVILIFAFKKRNSLFYVIKRKELMLIFFLGFISILLELILLLSYQIISGYVYWQMGILFASFMLGLFLGSLFGNQFKGNSRQIHSISLAILFLIIIGLSLCMAHLLPYFTYLSTTQNIFIFTALLVIIGSVIGACFVFASFLVNEDNVMKKAGSLYAADLWGASLGAILSANFIVPVFGILGALNFSAIIGVIGLAMFLILPNKN